MTNPWNEAGARRFARYEALPPGSYRFQVQACNEDGVWNRNGRQPGRHHSALFWQTGWFRAAAAAVAPGLVAAVVYFISTQKLQRQLAGLRQQQALEKERARIARDIHDQVGASLTQLALLGEMVEADKDDPEEAQAHARQISQTARETTARPGRNRLDGQPVQRHAGRIGQLYLQTSPGLPGRGRPALPPGRAGATAHHGHLPGDAAQCLPRRQGSRHQCRQTRRRHGSRVCVCAWKQKAFTLEIQDNGRGPAGLKEKAAESRNGLRNMRKRMEDIGGGFAIGPGPQGGTLVRLTVPLARPPSP